MRGMSAGNGGIAVISEKQIKMLWALARQLGLNDEGFHEMIKGLTGKDSIKDLMLDDVHAVVDKFAQAGVKVKKGRKPARDLPENVFEIITPEQTNFIRYLEEKLGWQDNPKRLMGFSKKIIGKGKPGTKEEGIKIILALKQMVVKESVAKAIEDVHQKN
jgi:Protein of unknown function (DUF1018)